MAMLVGLLITLIILALIIPLTYDDEDATKEEHAILLWLFYNKYGNMSIDEREFANFMRKHRSKPYYPQLGDYFNIKIHYIDAQYDKNGILTRGERERKEISLNDKGMSLIKKYYGREE